METLNCRWCATPLRDMPGGVPYCPHCDLNGHDPSGCTLCAAGARELDLYLRKLRRS